MIAPWLAQISQNKADRLYEPLGWLVGFILVLLVVAGVLMLVRKRLNDTSPGDRDLPFTLGDLRRIHREGGMTDDEFERAKQQIIALSTGEPTVAELDESSVIDDVSEFTEADEVDPADDNEPDRRKEDE